MGLGKGDVSAPPQGVLQVLPGNAGAQVLHLQPATANRNPRFIYTDQ